MVLSGLAARGLEPVGSQRCAISERHRVGTAADIVAFSEASNRLVVVELKCGYDHGRKAAAERDGKPCAMQAPLSRVSDCNLHRHMLQLCVTRHLFAAETSTLARLGELGIEPEVDAVLMYANDAGVEFYDSRVVAEARRKTLATPVADAHDISTLVPRRGRASVSCRCVRAPPLRRSPTRRVAASSACCDTAWRTRPPPRADPWSGPQSSACRSDPGRRTRLRLATFSRRLASTREPLAGCRRVREPARRSPAGESPSSTTSKSASS